MAQAGREPSRGRLLSVGLACVDIVNVAEDYPREDTDQRLLDQLVSRGGNAANTAVVLSQLGNPVDWLGTLAQDSLVGVITDDLNKFGVSYDNARYHDNCKCPMSCVIVNSATGSRTILHNNQTLPEVDLADFQKVDLCKYSWVHFEGRNLENVRKMIVRIEEFNERRKAEGLSTITVSLEAEKAREIPVDFLSRPDYLFISKEYAPCLGYQSALECLEGVKGRGLIREGARVICAWGEKGAWGLEENGRIVHSPAFPPITVVDTLAAGDTFNAGVLHALNGGQTLEEALRLGCRVAGQKVGRAGLKIDTTSLDL